MRVPCGGQAHEHDFHEAGLDRAPRSRLPAVAGFVDAFRVAEFGPSGDTSALRARSRPAGIGVESRKPGD